jgi:hypothetical protein
MWMDGWTNSHHEPTTRSSKMCEVPDIVHVVVYVKYLRGTDLRLLDSKQQNSRIT